MTSIFCLTEQQDRPAIRLLSAAATVTAHPLGDLAHHGWERPLILLGDELNGPQARTLLRRTYRNPAPLLVLPPLPPGDVTPLLDAPAPVTVIRQRANTVELADDALRAALGRDSLRVYCAEAIETALKSGVLATAGGRPVIWAYRPTRAATPVIWVAAQLLLVSARTDPLDREELLSALLAWAEACTRTGDDLKQVAGAEPEAKKADPGLLRALVLAWAVRPDLTRQALPGWLRERLFIQVSEAKLEVALEALRMEGALDAQNRPRAERLSDLVDEWGLRAWVREARRVDQG